VRTEQCACGGYIRAESLVISRQPVAIHNLTLPHLAWRLSRGIVTPSLDVPPHDPRRRWPTADLSPVDCVQGEDGASAGGVEGAA